MQKKLMVYGMVQGVGYRPFVAQMAEKYGINGWVRNRFGMVEIFAESGETEISDFVDALKKEFPVNARIDHIIVEDTEEKECSCFHIADSYRENHEMVPPLLPPDLAICDSCEKELKDSKNRRYRYPFISCVSCGPRYSIMKQLPYDRENTTMSVFPLCETCHQEYIQKGDRRRHAQTTACQECGPVLLFTQEYVGGIPQNSSEKEAALQAAVQIIHQGGIVAVRDIGGFHLACSPFLKKTVEVLRFIKDREKKPFAVMFASVKQAEEYAQISSIEKQEMESTARPIVLVRRKTISERKERVLYDGDSPDVGVMLPCNPLQVLLLEACGPLIMTSANASGQPIIIENHDMFLWMEKKKQMLVSFSLSHWDMGVLYHEREILMPLDDSIVRFVLGKRQIFRRSRGFVPEPIFLKKQEKKSFPVFATGGDMKACFCYMQESRAYLSQYLGDLEEASVMELYQRQMTRMKHLFDFQPKSIMTDLHPRYLSHQLAYHQKNMPVYEVQHHHAHVLSVMAEHGLTGPVMGVAFDGTGYGVDGTVWGSEFLYCQGVDMHRVGHLKPVELLGGDAGAKNTRNILYAYLLANHCEDEYIDSVTDSCFSKNDVVIKAAIQHHIHTVISSSMGRLFDAVSALLHICFLNTYEGEAAIALERIATKGKTPVSLSIDQETGDTSQLFRHIIYDLSCHDRENPVIQAENIANIALGFILAVAKWTVETIKCHVGVEVPVVLSGGTFQNRILLEKVIQALQKEGYHCYINEQVPPGDGGICLGQAYLYQMMENGKI